LVKYALPKAVINNRMKTLAKTNGSCCRDNYLITDNNYFIIGSYLNKRMKAKRGRSYAIGANNNAINT